MDFGKLYDVMDFVDSLLTVLVMSWELCERVFTITEISLKFLHLFILLFVVKKKKPIRH